MTVAPAASRSDAAPEPVSRPDLELPYGVAEDGRLVPVDKVPRGLACNCRCPQCDHRLIARQGEVLRWHFAHEAEESNCVGAFETMTHRLAKQIIADAGQIRLPALIGYFEGHAYRVMERARDAPLTDVRLEAWLGGIRPDILARCEDGTDLAIEIFAAHRCDSEKISRIRERELAAIEIDLSGFRAGLLTGDVFPEAVLRGPARIWLWNPKQAEANAIIAAEPAERRAKERAAAAEAEAARQQAAEKVKAAALAFEEADRQWKQRAAEREEADRQWQQQRRVEREDQERLAQKAKQDRWDNEQRAKAAPMLEGLRTAAVSASERRIAFLRSCPSEPVATESAPSCECRTCFLWRERPWHPWQCFTCDPPLDRDAVEVVRAIREGK